jgi:hypothetical protein
MIKNKLAISAIIGEVLLISLAIVMAGGVYAWLKFYVAKPLPTESCDEAVNLIISNYNCIPDKILNISLKNQGRFDINGVMIKISNKSGDELAIFPLTEIKFDTELGQYEDPRTALSFDPVLIPGNESTKLLNYSKYNQIDYLELEPTKGVDQYGRVILCEKSISKIPLTCL